MASSSTPAVLPGVLHSAVLLRLVASSRWCVYISAPPCSGTNGGIGEGHRHQHSIPDPTSTFLVNAGCRVPLEVLTELLKGSGLQTILNARAAASHLVAPASCHVKGLAAEDGDLPIGAWSSFPEATRLHVKWSDSGLSSRSNSTWIAKLEKLLPTIPSRVNGMSVDAPYGSLKLHPDTHLLASALLSAAFKNTLQELSLLSPSAL